MGNIKQRLTKLLRQQFAKCELELETTGNRVGGLLIWEGFEDMEQVDRQQRLAEIIKTNLTPAEQLQVSAILTMTPSEMANARQA